MQVEELVKLIGLLKGNDAVTTKHPYELGANYLIKTVTHYYTGKLIAVYPEELVLGHAAWIADTGRFNAALTKGELSEVEPIPGDVIIGRGAIVDVIRWVHELPKEVK